MAITLNGTTGITTPKLDALDLELGSKNVVERGSNANGDYVRFADGTQICTGTVEFPSGCTTAIGGLFRSSTFAGWTFPAEFHGVTGLCVMGADSSLASARWLVFSSTKSNTSTGFLLVSPSSSASADTPSVVAIGRWY